TRSLKDENLRLDPDGAAGSAGPVPAVREFGAGDRLDPLQSKKLDQLYGLGVHRGVGVDIAPRIERTGMGSLHRQPQVLVDAEFLEQAGDLERACETLPADAMRRRAGQIAAVQ